MGQNDLSRLNRIKQGVIVAMVVLGSSGIAMLANPVAQARLHSHSSLHSLSSPKTAEKAADAKAADLKAAPAPVATGPVQPVVSTDLLKDPGKFLNKRVSFDGTFNSFSSLGLDYKPAFRDGKDHVSFLILRPDVIGHNIPMSELKLIVPRKKVESIIHLDQGDKVQVKGQVFSAALGEPWLDVQEVTILQKAKGKEKDANKKALLDKPGSATKDTDKPSTLKTPDSKPVDVKTGEPKSNTIPATKEGKLEKIKTEKVKPVELPPDKKPVAPAEPVKTDAPTVKPSEKPQQ